MEASQIKSMEYVIIASIVVFAFTCILPMVAIKFGMMPVAQSFVLALVLDAMAIIATMVIYKIKK